MTNARYPIADHQDIETLGIYRKRRALGYAEEEIMDSIHAKSGDNARTPMQWSGEENAGFTTGTPWLRVNPNYTKINAASQVHDPDSVFACYQTLIRLRKVNPVFREGSFRLLLGNFENDEFGNYTRYTYYKPEACVVMQVNGKTLVLSGKDAAETQAIYQQLLDKTQ